MPHNLHILVTCTKRKSHDPEKSLVMRGLKGRTAEARLADWIARLEAATGPTIKVQDLYAGDHWQISSALPKLAADQGFRARLWVMSAGYGLVEATVQVHPYAAAFSPGHRDCVIPPEYPGGVITGFQTWWKGMAAWRGPSNLRAPRTITELFARNSRATFLVIASELYLRAVWDDLVQAATKLKPHRGGGLCIVSAGTKDFGPLAEFAMPVDARMQGSLGGARRSLNVRMARRLISWMAPGASATMLKQRCDRAMKGVEVSIQPRRPKCSDDEIISFIRRQAVRVAKPSASSLLRQFRDEAGRACEQRRFSRLFRCAREASHS